MEKPQGSGERVGNQRINSLRNAAIRFAKLKRAPTGMELLVKSGVVSAAKLATLRAECEELTAIFVTTLKRAKTS